MMLQTSTEKPFKTCCLCYLLAKAMYFKCPIFINISQSLLNALKHFNMLTRIEKLMTTDKIT
uniref:Uncharacterized protein n=1 Tax=Rhizophora mucronata TaxID=61149 RepID=A0A2P2NNI4_RHIMU